MLFLQIMKSLSVCDSLCRNKTIRSCLKSPERAKFNSLWRCHRRKSGFADKPCKGEISCFALAGLMGLGNFDPTRCAGLLNFAPLGLPKTFQTASKAFFTSVATLQTSENQIYAEVA
jgi:hypothetical protein